MNKLLLALLTLACASAFGMEQKLVTLEVINSIPLTTDETLILSFAAQAGSPAYNMPFATGMEFNKVAQLSPKKFGTVMDAAGTCYWTTQITLAKDLFSGGKSAGTVVLCQHPLTVRIMTSLMETEDKVYLQLKQTPDRDFEVKDLSGDN